MSIEESDEERLDKERLEYKHKTGDQVSEECTECMEYIREIEDLKEKIDGLKKQLEDKDSELYDIKQAMDKIHNDSEGWI